MPTIRDVARRAGVAPATVSRVINNPSRVSIAKRERVLAAIAELKFVPNTAARRLSLRRTLSIAVIAPFFTNPSSVERLRGLAKSLAATHYDLVVFDVEGVERRDKCFAEVPRPDRADGVVIISLTPSDEQACRFQTAEVPVVLLDAQHPRLPSIMEDSQHGGWLAADHLITLGHRRIGYISDTFEDPFNFVSRSYLRFQGYRAALQSVGLPYDPDYSRQGEHGREPARRMALELLRRPEPPTAIFAASDTQAIGVLTAARELGLRVPQDLSLVGYDDIEAADYVGLTTVRQSLRESGQRAARLVLQAIQGQLGLPHAETLPVGLVVRHTTAPPASD